MARKRVAIVPIALAVALAASPAASQPAPALGPPAPPFEGLRLDASGFDSAELAGGYVLLDFWGVWCPPCIGAFPELSRLHDDYSGRGFQVVGLAVLSGTPEEVAEFLESYDVTYPIVVVERAVPEAFGVLAFPAYILLGPEGGIVRRFDGQPNDIYELVSGDLERLLPVDTPTPPG